ncbi:MAG: ABC transporter substrate-binding protein [Thermoguttaceae bacterium]
MSRFAFLACISHGGGTDIPVSGNGGADILVCRGKRCKGGKQECLPHRAGRVLTAGVLWLSCFVLARAEQPLYEQEPYDQITLNAAFNNEVIKIKPLDIPNRMPLPHKTVGKLKVRRLDKPDKEYEVAWHDIAKFELFEELILSKANELSAAHDFETAYDYFVYLEANKPNLPGLGQSMEANLYREAGVCKVNGQYDAALALLREVFERDRRRSGLDKALGWVTDKLAVNCEKDNNYPAIRMLLRNLASDYPEHPIVAQWRERLTRQAAPLLAEANKAVDAGRWSKAAELTRQVANIWPELPGARELALIIHRKYPRVVVGVGSLSADVAPSRLDDWTVRRTSRLLFRTLSEFAGPGSEGGKYDCPVGEISMTNQGRRLLIQLKAKIGWAQGNATLTNSDVARQLLAMTDANQSAYRVDWADLMMAVSSRGVYNLDVDLRRPHVRPEAMLQIVLTPRGASVKPGEMPPTNGPFTVQSRSPRETVFAANPQYFAAVAGQPNEIVERRYPSVAKAVEALRRGEIQVLDRVNPWSLAALRADPHLIVQAYACPLVHCLIPNLHRPIVSDRAFRRALIYGIFRQGILQQILGGVDAPGCVVTSSPFPLGVDSSDPMGYASDDSIEPRPYLPRLTVALAGVTLKYYLDAQKDAAKKNAANQDAAKKDPAKKPKKPSLPPLVLAYPRDEVAAAACASIQKQLKLVDITIVLKPLDGPMPARVPDDVDLLYAELPMWEPLVDARRVLGEEGIAGGCSPFMTLALRQLDEAVDWKQVRECLHAVHRISFDDAAIIPLWQLVEYFACHDSIKGVAPRPVSLYQNVEQWRAPFQYPADK